MKRRKLASFQITPHGQKIDGLTRTGIQCSVFESSGGGVTKAVDKRPHYVGVTSLSVLLLNISLFT